MIKQNFAIIQMPRRDGNICTGDDYNIDESRYIGRFKNSFVPASVEEIKEWSFREDAYYDEEDDEFEHTRECVPFYLDYEEFIERDNDDGRQHVALESIISSINFIFEEDDYVRI